jgi:hypothetical protein
VRVGKREREEIKREKNREDIGTYKCTIRKLFVGDPNSLKLKK